MNNLQRSAASAGAVFGLALALPAGAVPLSVVVTVENLAPGTSVAVSPLSFAFHGGTHDPFDAGAPPTADIVPVAELGSGEIWLSGFATADPGAVTGTSPGPLTPGGSGSTLPFLVETDVNAWFSFGAMVVPSNDYFIGNDDPRAWRLFDDGGNLLLGEITLVAGDIWHAGSEAFNVANAAFIAGSDASARIAEDGIVTRDFAGIGLFTGLTTAAGYAFQPELSDSTPIYRISFRTTDVPEPGMGAVLLGGLGLLFAMRRPLKSPLRA